ILNLPNQVQLSVDVRQSPGPRNGFYSSHPRRHRPLRQNFEKSDPSCIPHVCPPAKFYREIPVKGDDPDIIPIFLTKQRCGPHFFGLCKRQVPDFLKGDILPDPVVYNLLYLSDFLIRELAEV